MHLIPQGFKANPGLKLANAFSVKLKLTAMGHWGMMQLLQRAPFPHFGFTFAKYFVTV